MKNILLWSFTILLILSVAWMANQTVSKLHNKQKADKNKSVLNTELPIYTMDSTKYAIPRSDKPIMIVLFNPDCDHCENEIARIKESIGSFGDTKILMVSSEPLSKIKAFSTKHELTNYPQIAIYKINNEKMYESFGAVSFPQILLYGGDSKLIKEFKGQTKIESIIKYIP